MTPFPQSGNSAPRNGSVPSRPLSIVTIGLDSETLNYVTTFVETDPLVRLSASLHPSGSEEFRQVHNRVGILAPDVCILDFDPDRPGAVAVAERIRASVPGTAIFAVSSQTEPDAIIEAMRSGCSEYFVKPIGGEELLKGLARLGDRSRIKTESNAQVFAFMGAKGGCGVTTLITHFGALLASSLSRRTLLVDLHENFGDVALYLGLAKQAYHSFELIQNVHRLDEEFLQSFLVRHSSGLDLIPAPEEGDSSRNVVPGELTKVLQFLRHHYEFILLDLPSRLDEQILEPLRQSDQICLITVSEVAALRNVVRQADYFLQNQIPEGKIRVILNRYQERGMITDGEIEKAIRRRIFWRVPNQYAYMVKTISSGNPIMHLSKSNVMHSLNEWARAVCNKQDGPSNGQEIRGLFGFLGSLKSALGSRE